MSDCPNSQGDLREQVGQRETELSHLSDQAEGCNTLTWSVGGAPANPSPTPGPHSLRCGAVGHSHMQGGVKSRTLELVARQPLRRLPHTFCAVLMPVRGPGTCPIFGPLTFQNSAVIY